MSETLTCQALADLGASINLMPYSLYAKLALGALKPTRMSVRLADRSCKYPMGIAENMTVKVGKFVFPADFVILEMEEDSKVPLILGRPFLHTADAIIKVKNREISLGVGEERCVFSIDSALKHPYSYDDTCFRIEVIDPEDELDWEEILEIEEELRGAPQEKVEGPDNKVDDPGAGNLCDPKPADIYDELDWEEILEIEKELRGANRKKVEEAIEKKGDPEPYDIYDELNWEEILVIEAELRKELVEKPPDIDAAYDLDWKEALEIEAELERRIMEEINVELVEKPPDLSLGQSLPEERVQPAVVKSEKSKCGEVNPHTPGKFSTPGCSFVCLIDEDPRNTIEIDPGGVSPMLDVPTKRYKVTTEDERGMSGDTGGFSECWFDRQYATGWEAADFASWKVYEEEEVTRPP